MITYLNIPASEANLVPIFSNGLGSSINVNLLMKISPLDMLLNTKAANDAKVYGNITLQLYPNNQVRVVSQEQYNFEMHNWWNPLNWARNVETLYGSHVAGNGTPFFINISGSAYIPTEPLPNK